MPPTFLESGLQVIDLEVIDDAIRRIVSAFHPKRIVLFGSQARGDARPDSDLDLFIEMESNQRPGDRRLAVRRLFQDCRWPLDVVVYTPKEVAQARERFGNLMSYVDAEGKLLYES